MLLSMSEWGFDDYLHGDYLLKRMRKESFTLLMHTCDQGLPDDPDDPLNCPQHLPLLLPEDLEGAEELQDIELPKKTPRRNRSNRKPRKPPTTLLPEEPKQIGTISLELRKAKISRFMEKRKRRQWGRKISYDCRKRVADGRLRCKGRFIRKDQSEQFEEKSADETD